MPNINLTDSRHRDAVVKAESVRVTEKIQYVGPKGQAAWPRKILKSTVDHDLDALVAQFGDPEAVGSALLNSDPEVDMELFGQFLWNVSRVYVNAEEDVVFRVEQREVVRNAAGKKIETRPKKSEEANVDAEHPILWSGTLVDKSEAVRKFVFVSKLQIVHINGLTYDFLYGMASELAAAGSLLLVGAGANGKQPLVFRRGSTPYRGFLEGRVDGDNYILLLHLSNIELKSPMSSSA